jgi:hypothetical protein
LFYSFVCLTGAKVTLFSKKQENRDIFFGYNLFFGTGVVTGVSVIRFFVVYLAVLIRDMENMVRVMVLLVSLFLLASCDKPERQLEGKWLLKEVEENGVVTPVDTVWYNFQTSLFQYQIYDRASDTYQVCYGYKVMNDEHSLDLELTFDYEGVRDFLPLTDWDSAKRHFEIESLTGKELRLSGDGKRYHFSKF